MSLLNEVPDDLRSPLAEMPASVGTTGALFYFRLVRGTIRNSRVIESLSALLTTTGGNPLIVRNGLQANWLRLVHVRIKTQQGRVALERLPAYAPELNSVENLWRYCKHHSMPRYFAADHAGVTRRVKRNLRSMRRRPTLVRASWQKVESS